MEKSKKKKKQESDAVEDGAELEQPKAKKIKTSESTLDLQPSDGKDESGKKKKKEKKEKKTKKEKKEKQEEIPTEDIAGNAVASQ